jgi:hypothetical protein
MLQSCQAFFFSPWRRMMILDGVADATSAATTETANDAATAARAGRNGMETFRPFLVIRRTP